MDCSIVRLAFSFQQLHPAQNTTTGTRFAHPIRWIGKLLLLLCLFSFSTAQASDWNRELDSLKTVLASLSTPEAKFTAVYRIGVIQSNINPDSARRWASWGRQLAEKSDNDSLRAESFFLAGISLSHNKEMGYGIAELRKANHFFVVCRDTFGLLRSRFNLGNVLMYNQSYTEALVEFKNCIELCDTIGDETQLPLIHNSMGGIYEDLFLYTTAIKSYRKALFYAQKLDYPYTVAVITGGIGNVYLKLENLDSARVYVTKALHLDREFGTTLALIRDLTNMSSIFNRMDQADSALFYADLSLAKSKDKDWALHRGFALVQRGEALIRSGRMEEGVEFLRNGNRTGIRESDRNLQINACEQLHLAFAKSGVADSAYHYLLLFDSLSYDPVNEKKVNEVVTASIEYERKLGEQRLLFAEKESEYRSERLWYQVVGIGAVTILVLIIVLLQWHRSRVQARLNEQLSNRNNVIITQNASLSALMEEKKLLYNELYHRTSNNLQSIYRLLQRNVEKEGGNPGGSSELLDQIQIFSLIHEQLRDRPNGRQVELNRFMDNFISQLSRKFELPSEQLQFSRAKADLLMHYNRAIGLGMGLHELVTNSIKHYANPNERIRISVELERSEKEVHLMVADNGSGIGQSAPTEPMTTGSGSEGLSILNSWVKSVNGNLEISNHLGAMVRITVPLNDGASAQQ